MTKPTEQLLFDTGPYKRKRVQKITVQGYHFRVEMGQLLIEVEMLDSREGYAEGRKKIEAFRMVRERAEEHKRGVDYAVREEIMGRLK